MSEHALQVAVAHMLTIVLDPELTWWSAIDHGAGKLSKRSAGMMRARGVKRGLPDVIVLALDTPDRIVGIELKTAIGRVSDVQREVGDAWQRLGSTIYLARSLEGVQDILIEARVPMRSRMKFFGGADGRPEGAPRPRHPRARRRRKPKNHLPVLQRRSAQA